MTAEDWKPSAAAVADGLLPFQRAFVQAVCRTEKPPEIAALSVPRGNGKSWLCGSLIARSLVPGDPLFEPGVENILVSSSTNQARIVLEFARQALGEAEGYRWRNDGVVHLARPGAGSDRLIRCTPRFGPWRERPVDCCG